MITNDENAVRPYFRLSVRLFVKRVDCDKTEERSVQIIIPGTIRKIIFSLVFWEKKMVGEATPSTWNFGSTGPR